MAIIMDVQKRDQIFQQYVDQYTPTINKTLEVLRLNSNLVQIPYAQFLFSMVDYFGLLFTVASTDHYNKFDKENFLRFLKSDYFLTKDRCKASLLWFVRNGLIHQIFPKATGIGTTAENSLFFRDKQNGGSPTLNLSYFDRELDSAIKKFIKDLSSKIEYVDRLHKTLIVEHYGFDDFEEFQKEINKSFSGDKEKIFF